MLHGLTDADVRLLKELAKEHRQAPRRRPDLLRAKGLTNPPAIVAKPTSSSGIPALVAATTSAGPIPGTGTVDVYIVNDDDELELYESNKDALNVCPWVLSDDFFYPAVKHQQTGKWLLESPGSPDVTTASTQILRHTSYLASPYTVTPTATQLVMDTVVKNDGGLVSLNTGTGLYTFLKAGSVDLHGHYYGRRGGTPEFDMWSWAELRLNDVAIEGSRMVISFPMSAAADPETELPQTAQCSVSVDVEVDDTLVIYCVKANKDDVIVAEGDGGGTSKETATYLMIRASNNAAF